MDRDEFMELVYETFADEPDNVLANGIIEAADAYVEHEKAQLSKEGTTFDLISRQAAISAICNACGKIDCDKMDKCEKLQLPPANCSEFPNNSDLISRQAALEKVRTMQTYKLFMGDDMILVDKAEVQTELMMLPPAQPERKGRWIKLDMHAHLADHKCTACGQECYVPTCMGEPMYTYCPNCGAKMTISK